MTQTLYAGVNKRKKKKPSPTTCVGEDLGKKEPSYTAGRNASWCNHSGKKFGDFLTI
jgi:hypothetical protein